MKKIQEEKIDRARKWLTILCDKYATLTVEELEYMETVEYILGYTGKFERHKWLDMIIKDVYPDPIEGLDTSKMFTTRWLPCVLLSKKGSSRCDNCYAKHMIATHRIPKTSPGYCHTYTIISYIEKKTKRLYFTTQISASNDQKKQFVDNVNILGKEILALIGDEHGKYLYS